MISRDSASLKRAVSQARLVVVHSREIDDSGEKGIGPAVFDLALQKLRAAWRVLREAGVRRFVFTADHGFLLLDDAAAAQAHGRRIDPQRRHVFSPVAADRRGEVRVALADLGYEGTGTSVIFPESTAVFDSGRWAVSFAHGGNSLQERVIPVLTVVHRTAAGGSGIRYGVTAEAREGVAGMHCIEARIEVIEQQSLDFGSPQEIELAVRVPDAEDVQVELCQARGRARIAGSTIVAAVGVPFELFFRLSGATDMRALIEIHHPSAVADVVPYVPDARFPVTTMRAPAPSAATPPRANPAADTRWIEQFPDPGIRQAQGFATSFVVVSDNDLKFHRFDDVYRKVLTELGTASCPRGALGDVLDRWIGRVEEALVASGEDDADPAFDATVAKHLDEDLAAMTDDRAPQDFVRVIQAIFELKQQQGNVAEAGALISWLCGSGNVAASVKRTAGIKGDIESRDALDYLRGALEIVKAAGWACTC